MKRHLLAGLAAAALVVGLSASSANAQCAFQHPKKAGKFQSNFVTAFISCDNAGGHTDNTVAGGGAAPACKPPMTYAEDQGTPPNTWYWDPNKGQGQVQFKAVKKTKIPTVDPLDSSDVAVILKLAGVSYGTTGDPGDLVNGASGRLATLTRTTFDDREAGDVTVVDFPVKFPFILTLGKTTLKMTADQQLNADGLAGLPHCASLETVSVTVLDQNNNAFATSGVFMPSL
jgi:hypothetical protein